MEKPVDSAEEEHTNLSFDLPGHPTNQAYSLVAANVIIHEAWIRTSRASYGSRCASLDLAKENGSHSMPPHQPQTELERTQQNQKALHLLVLSGVVRPSYLKLRYAIPLLNDEDQSRPFPGKPVTAVRPSRLLQKFFQLMSWLTMDKRSFWQHRLSSNNHLRFRKSLSPSTRSSS
jgi:hypothetical protein